jgi:hypothetical protein
MKWDAPDSRKARRAVASAMSRQAYRLERQLTAIRTGAEHRLGETRAAQAVWQFAAKQSEFGHLVVAGYRDGRYSPIASLARTLYEDATLLAWCAVSDDAQQQAARVSRILLDYYRTVRNKGRALPPDADAMLKQVTGAAARRPPSMEDRACQLDEHERSTDGKPFWATHLDHVSMLNDYVHAELGGAPRFIDPMTRELLGFEVLMYSHQYLTLSIVSVVRLSDQNALAKRAQEAYDRVHPETNAELNRLIR